MACLLEHVLILLEHVLVLRLELRSQFLLLALFEHLCLDDRIVRPVSLTYRVFHFRFGLTGFGIDVFRLLLWLRRLRDYFVLRGRFGSSVLFFGGGWFCFNDGFGHRRLGWFFLFSSVLSGIALEFLFNGFRGIL